MIIYRLCTPNYCMTMLAISLLGVLLGCKNTVTHTWSAYQVSIQLPVGWEISGRVTDDDVLVADRIQKDEGVGSIWMQLHTGEDVEGDLLAIWKTKAEEYADHYPNGVISKPVLTNLYGYTAAQGTLFWEGKISKEPGPGEFVPEFWNRTILEIIWVDLEDAYLVVGSLASVNTPALSHPTTEEKINRIIAEINRVTESLKIISLKQQITP